MTDQHWNVFHGLDSSLTKPMNSLGLLSPSQNKSTTTAKCVVSQLCAVFAVIRQDDSLESRHCWVTVRGACCSSLTDTYPGGVPYLPSRHLLEVCCITDKHYWGLCCVIIGYLTEVVYRVIAGIYQKRCAAPSADTCSESSVLHLSDGHQLLRCAVAEWLPTPCGKPLTLFNCSVQQLCATALYNYSVQLLCATALCNCWLAPTWGAAVPRSLSTLLRIYLPVTCLNCAASRIIWIQILDNSNITRLNYRWLFMLTSLNINVTASRLIFHLGCCSMVSNQSSACSRV